jgi:hypothetical protein
MVIVLGILSTTTAFEVGSNGFDSCRQLTFDDRELQEG